MENFCVKSFLKHLYNLFHSTKIVEIQLFRSSFHTRVRYETKLNRETLINFDTYSFVVDTSKKFSFEYETNFPYKLFKNYVYSEYKIELDKQKRKSGT